MTQTVTLGGNPIPVNGDFPQKGQTAPAFSLVSPDLADISLESLGAKRKILNIFPSIDTPTCATSTRKFNAAASGLNNTVVLCISADLPFAQKRFCGAEGIANVVTASDFKDKKFGTAWGVTFADGPLQGLLSRSVVVTDAAGKVVYTEQVAETTSEPNYEKALAAAKGV